MRAVVIAAHGGPDVLTVAQLPDPVPVEGEVLVRIEAIGLNHAELYMRSGKWGDLPRVTGIECAGVVEDDRSGRFAPGTRVVALMGGMGRTRNGSYAELVTVPATNVVAVDTALSWTDLVALPEVYATAWSVLHQNLAVRPGETLLVRGATSALGQAAADGAVDLGTEPFPVEDIPIAHLVARAEAGAFRAKPARVFRFEEIAEAHRVMEANEAGGKLVVTVR